MCLAAALMLMLGGCNMVYTTKPLFSAVDASGAPGFRAGIWASPEVSCTFDAKASLRQWPECANGGVVTNTEFDNPTGKGVGGKSSKTPYVLAPGEPRIVQIYLPTTWPQQLKADADYIYFGLRADNTDEQGRITAFTWWPVMCGPPPKPRRTRTEGSASRYGTRHPLPGLMMDRKGASCTTRSPGAMRAAAKASVAWSMPSTHSRWIRDGDR